ncbi:hypothetical protein JOB18_039496 [Solea senegalensis]|uniref:Uncharacterized protein n=1 Tax=Solea senegalensis TaxID=28829 RepID=A0AAV6RGC2_SOLSE|nr:hypothetical protein JOB18_039496 [Solea senegalensis]
MTSSVGQKFTEAFDDAEFRAGNANKRLHAQCRVNYWSAKPLSRLCFVFREQLVASYLGDGLGVTQEWMKVLCGQADTQSRVTYERKLSSAFVLSFAVNQVGGVEPIRCQSEMVTLIKVIVICSYGALAALVLHVVVPVTGGESLALPHPLVFLVMQLASMSPRDVNSRALQVGREERRTNADWLLPASHSQNIPNTCVIFLGRTSSTPVQKTFQKSNHIT